MRERERVCVCVCVFVCVYCVYVSPCLCACLFLGFSLSTSGKECAPHCTWQGRQLAVFVGCLWWLVAGCSLSPCPVSLVPCSLPFAPNPHAPGHHGICPHVPSALFLCPNVAMSQCLISPSMFTGRCPSAPASCLLPLISIVYLAHDSIDGPLKQASEPPASSFSAQSRRGWV